MIDALELTSTDKVMRIDIKNFFSGHEYRRHSLMDRESFARVAIGKILESHPEDNFETTGEIIKHESVMDQSEEPEALDGVVKAIKADGQQDVDAEVRSRPMR